MIAGGASFIPSSWVLFMCLGVSVSDDGLGYLTRWSETGPDLPSAGNGTEVPLFGNETDVLSLGNETDSSPLVLLSNGTVINKSSPGKILYIPFRNSTRPKEDDESSYKKMNASYIRENLFTKKVPSEKRAIIPSRYHNPVPPKPATPNIYKELLDSPPIPSPATVEYEEGEDDYGVSATLNELPCAPADFSFVFTATIRAEQKRRSSLWEIRAEFSAVDAYWKFRRL